MTVQTSKENAKPKYSNNIYFVCGMLTEISLQNLSIPPGQIEHGWFNKAMLDLTGCIFTPDDWSLIEAESCEFGQVYEAMANGKEFAKDLPKFS